MGSPANIALISNEGSYSSLRSKSCWTIVEVPEKKHIHIDIRTNNQLNRIGQSTHWLSNSTVYYTHIQRRQSWVASTVSAIFMRNSDQWRACHWGSHNSWEIDQSILYVSYIWGIKSNWLFLIYNDWLLIDNIISNCSAIATWTWRNDCNNKISYFSIQAAISRLRPCITKICAIL